MNRVERLMHPGQDGETYVLRDPVRMPKASGFLWNESMMLHATCRGYVTAQYMQPEPAKYSYPPILEAKTFLLPEPSYYAHHPGRFVYVKDEADGALFSAPYEPVRSPYEAFAFTVGKSDLRWHMSCGGIEVDMRLSLPRSDALELWRVRVRNASGRQRALSVYPYFTVGYMSWMNQGGAYNADLQAIVCSAVTPYQKYEDYARVKAYKDKTFLWAQQAPDAWEVCQQRFEGEGGLAAPDGVRAPRLSCRDSRYEMPLAVMQYSLALADGEAREWRFVFGPAKDEAEIERVCRAYGGDGFERAEAEYAGYLAGCKPALWVETPDTGLDNYVNHWLPRQMFFHGMTNRLSTDPQTRNYLQDAMGMSYVQPQVGRDAFLFALGQQQASGAMPDGILLYAQAELKYINQVPHTDHCVWLPVCLHAYLAETGDYALLEEEVPFADDARPATVARHIDLAVEWLVRDRDARGLNYIRQGDWCDPMNAVGYKGKGVSGWLTMGTAYALRVWSEICADAGRAGAAAKYAQTATEINGIINQTLWDGAWYARGITDDGVLFGVRGDDEGRIYLNAQSWALLCGAPDEARARALIQSVEDQLESPYGAEVLAPAYTHMREDVGRLTQKYPGTTENGSVYNHASAFYIYALYASGYPDRAYSLARRMLPGEEEQDVIRRGQLPVFIPNYYRGAYRQLPETAGRSSHLFCTGTISWYYRCVVEGLFGLKGVREGLSIRPGIPSHWGEVSVRRHFRGAVVHLRYVREQGAQGVTVMCDGQRLPDQILRCRPGQEYNVTVILPIEAEA